MFLDSKWEDGSKYSSNSLALYFFCMQYIFFIRFKIFSKFATFSKDSWGPVTVMIFFLHFDVMNIKYRFLSIDLFTSDFEVFIFFNAICVCCQ